MTNTNLRLAFYSKTAADLYGSSFYQTADGKEVEVTAVEPAMEDTGTYKWPDRIAVGPVTHWIRKGWVGRHKLAWLCVTNPLIIEHHIMTSPIDKVPTVDEMLDCTAVGNGFHDWAVEGGVIRVTTDELRPVLEAAYDSSNPNWVALIDWDEENGFHVA